ncbi:MAG TPA: hypothetical protein P5287_03095 [bacterium]|nr:hypothetical protein [bacterium]
MRKLIAVAVISMFVFSALTVKAEMVELKEHNKFEPADIVIIPVEAVGTCINVPHKVFMAGCVMVNNAIYKNDKRCYYCASGDEHPTGIKCVQQRGE